MKTIALFAATLLGAFCPWAEKFNWLIRYQLIFMMFVSMLQVRGSKNDFRRSLLILFAVNVAIGMGVWLLIRCAGGNDLAQAAFFTGISPTAAAAAVVVSLLGGSTGYTVNSFLLTNFGIALLMPVLIPLVTGNTADGIILKVSGDVLILVGIPAAAAFLCRKVWPGYRAQLGRLKLTSFYSWVVMIFLIIGKASAFIRRSRVPLSVLAEIAALTLGICILNFWLGGKLENKYRRRESSQCLGQKNTAFTICLALLYGTPLAALGPTCYVIWHNSWNAIQLRLREKRRHRHPEGKNQRPGR